MQQKSHDKTAFINGSSWLFLWSSRAGQIRTISHCFCGSQGILKADGLRAILVVERDQHPVIIQENGVHKNLNQCFALFCCDISNFLNFISQNRMKSALKDGFRSFSSAIFAVSSSF